MTSSDTEDIILSIINGDPEFMIPEPKLENYKFVIVAFNDKGESNTVDIEKTDVVDESEGKSQVLKIHNIT